MEERFTIRSVLMVFCVLLAVFCVPTEQRPRCTSLADCGENSLGLEKGHQRSLKSQYISAVEDPTAMKKLLETILMQHNEFVEANAFGTEEEENATERPPTGSTSFVDAVHQWQLLGAAENASTSISSSADSRDEGQYTSSGADEVDEENSTERPPVNEGSPMDTMHQLKPKDESGSKKMVKDIEDDESAWEHTTVVPQQLASPLDTHEFHFEPTTMPPNVIQLENLSGQVDVATQTPVYSMKKNNTSSYLGNIPPTKFNKKTTKRTTTKRPSVILRPQQLDTFTKTPETPSGSQDKIKRKPTTKPDEKINSLKPVDRDQDIRGEIQLEILNRPISTSKPLATTATPVGVTVNATSSRPNKKPINIIPETVVRNGLKPATGIGKPQGSGIRNPTPTPSSDDYLISALASIAADDGDKQDDYEDEEEDDEEDEEEDDGNADSNESGEEEEDDYLTDSLEENEERENFDYISSGGASDVISSVMEEVGALI